MAFRQIPGLRVVMAVSHDGFVARGPRDDMTWTPKADKEVFQMLTGVGGTLGVGRVTAECMPPRLLGRTLHVLSNRPGPSGMTLGAFAFRYPGGWLIGGQTIVLEALSIGLVDEVHLCRNQLELGEGVADRITPFLYKSSVSGGSWHEAMETRLSMGGVEVEVWRLGR